MRAYEAEWQAVLRAEGDKQRSEELDQDYQRHYAGADLSGQYTRIWDGRDDWGRLARPGVYLYRIQVRADAGNSSRQGVVQVVY